MSSPVRLQRFLQGFSQQVLAEQVGVSQGTLSRIERGEAPETPKNLEARARIAEILNIPECVLFLKGR
ncbi:MAG: helix-turn-helix transcriptional regulator [Acidobacteria bacterium]|nr:helix-turn-helix transcriptional regulator [Acidobacteriota bacterium]